MDFGFILGCPIDKCDVLTFDVAEFAHTVAERFGAAFYIGTGSHDEIADAGIFAGC